MEKINFVNNDAPYLSAENLNQMQDNIEEAIRDTYSTEETFTGKYWIDGKKIYRKVFTFTFNSGETTKNNNTTQSLNVETVITLKGICTSDPISESYYLSNADRLTINMNSSKILYVNIGSSYPTTPTNVNVILEYTKTTD